MNVKLSAIVGFACGKNVRAHFDVLGVNEVLFASELAAPIPAPEPKEGEEQGAPVLDTRDVLYDLVFGPNATAETRKEFLNRMKKEESIWRTAMSMAGIGQTQPISVRPVGDGQYVITDGARRYVSKTLAYVFNPDAGEVNGCAADEIKVTIDATEEGKQQLVSCASNIHRKEMNALEIGRQCDSLKAAGFSMKDIAIQLNLYTATGKPASQTVRNMANLFHSDITDAERDRVAKGKLSYTKLLQSKGLMKVNSETATAETDESEARTTVRKRSKTLKELVTLMEDVKKLEKYATAIEEKGLTGVEAVRFILSKAANVTYRPLKVEVDAAPAA